MAREFSNYFLLCYLAQIYLNGTGCCRVQPSDRLGFTNELDTTALGYVFETFNVGDLSSDVNSGSQLPHLGDVIDFVPNLLPYRYALSAAYDTGRWFLFNTLTM